ncbi:hypothetical protein Gpo141_00011682 [Globisporangium polare]
MTGYPTAAGGALPRDQQQRERRALMQQQPQGPPPLPLFGATQMPSQQQQSPPPFVGMSVGMGLTMNMSDMESSIRAYQPMLPHQQHQQVQPQPQQHLQDHPPQQHDGSSMAFWRGQSGMDASAVLSGGGVNAYAKHGSGALEFELGDILGSSNSSNSNMDDHERETNQNGGDVAMAAMGSSFEVSAFGEHMHAGTGAVGTMKPGYHLNSSSQPHLMLLRQQQQLAVRDGAVVTGAMADQDMGRPVRSESNASSAGGGVGDDSISDGSSEFSRFVEPRDAPDLSQQKIDAKNEKCQFHNCPNRARVSQAYGKFCNRHVIVAPCGFPGCRDKALLNASMCEKHLQEGKDALHKVLATRAQNVPVCRTFGCFKNDQGRGYCRGHEKLLMATGRLPKHVNKRRLNSAYTMCSYPGCDKHSQRNHLCRTHGNLITKQAEELCTRSNGETFAEILSRLQQNVRKCTNPTCTKNSQRDRLCTMHYYEKHNPPRDGTGSEQASEAPLVEATATTCTVPDCSMQAVTKGVCKAHSGQRQKSPRVSEAAASGIREVERTRCNVPGCVQVSYASGFCVQHFNPQQQPQHEHQQQEHQSLQQQHQEQPQPQEHSVQVSRYGSAISPFGDLHFSAPMEPSSMPRPSTEAFYPIASGSAYGSSMDPNMSSYPGMSSIGRHLPSAAGVGGVGASSDAENEVKQALFILNARPTDSGRAYNSHDGSVPRSTGSSICSNLSCNRQTYGREYCEMCQSMFSPLVVSVGGDAQSGGGTSYAFSSSSQPDPETNPQGWGEAAPQGKLLPAKAYVICRVGQCGAIVPSPESGGLCEIHFRSFEDGALSVDEITLRSKLLNKEEERSATAAGNSGAKSPTSGGKGRKYLCKTEGCDKQAQRKGACKRHFRLQELESRKASSTGSASGFAFPNQTSAGASQPAVMTPCRFTGCTQLVGRSAPWLCPTHASASFCWQPGCEVIVNGPQFCETHAYHKQCAYEGCTFPANRGASGCSNHAMERRCSHEYCDKFTVGRTGARCRLHQISCKAEPCALCELHGLGAENVPCNMQPGAQRSSGAGGGRGTGSRRKVNSENFQGGGNQ